MTEHKQKPCEYRFIRSKPDPEKGWVAIFADQNVLGEAGVAALRSAASRANQFNSISSRGGIHIFDADKLNEIKAVHMAHSLHENVRQITRALEVLDAKIRGEAVPPLPQGQKAQHQVRAH
jgi:hypothetical protein